MEPLPRLNKAPDAFPTLQRLLPRGRPDQAQAIAKLVKSIRAGNRHQTLLGVTGSGKSFTMANIIEQIGKPTLIMSHNKTLAAPLYPEFETSSRTTPSFRRHDFPRER